MKFAVAYSTGKDSALALWRMMQDGHEPVCLIVNINREAGRSWFHGINYELLDAVSERMGIPLIKCASTGENYHTEFEKGLLQAAARGAEACVFGDIDIDEHLEWNQARCETAGVKCIVPLWKQNREKLVYELLDAGIQAVIKCVESKFIGDELLGKTLDRDVVELIRATGSDICGENGEYHTFVYGGPMFHAPVNFRGGKIIDFGTHSVIDLLPLIEQEPEE
ncbi:ATP-binding protein [Spirochaetia bacterium]|nr:ATP-binding protein [Spirochaetia bacterium]